MQKLLLFSLLVTAFFACKQENAPDAKAEDKKQPFMTIPARSCYVYAANGDTFSLKLTIMDAKVMGTLAYNFAQKDDNQGSLEGVRNEDKSIIYADYTFTSEGIRSVREVAFKKTGNNLVEGFGEMEEKNGKMVFKDRNALNFDNNLIFHTINCPRQ